MLKHMLTSKCTRSCAYCITRNIRRKQELDLKRVENTYLDMYANGHKEIMLTGGEPTIAEKFISIVLLALEVFDKVRITTQNEKIFEFDGVGNLHSIIACLDSVTFSLHDISLAELNIKPHEDYNNNIPNFYAAILESKYRHNPNLIDILKENGWDGLTINEEQRGEIESERPWIPSVVQLSFKIKRNNKGHCLNETMILPDLDVITDYKPYL